MMMVDDQTEDPVGRRIDDVLTTAQTFDVAGFGEVRLYRLSILSALALPLGRAAPPPDPAPPSRLPLATSSALLPRRCQLMTPDLLQVRGITTHLTGALLGKDVKINNRPTSP